MTIATPRSSIDIGLWRSTLGETHPHSGFDVELDWWPQSAHVTELEWSWDATPEILRGIVACFSGGGGGSQPALFRKDLVPLLERASKSFRAGRTKTLDDFLREVQRGFEKLREPEWHVHFDATMAALHFADGRFTLAANGIERIFRHGAGGTTRVMRGRALLDGVKAEDLTKTEAYVRDLLASSPAGRFCKPENPGDHPRWHVSDPMSLAKGESLVLVTGGDAFSDERVAAGLAKAKPEASNPERARILGEYLADPSSWSTPPTEKEGEPRKIRWKVVSRTAIAIVSERT